MSAGVDMSHEVRARRRGSGVCARHTLARSRHGQAHGAQGVRPGSVARRGNARTAAPEGGRPGISSDPDRARTGYFAVTGRRANQLRYGALLVVRGGRFCVSPTGFEPVLPP